MKWALLGLLFLSLIICANIRGGNSIGIGMIGLGSALGAALIQASENKRKD
jgi:hypothetical protein